MKFAGELKGITFIDCMFISRVLDNFTLRDESEEILLEKDKISDRYIELKKSMDIPQARNLARGEWLNSYILDRECIPKLVK